MRFLSAILEALTGFVQRNPLTVLIVLLLALGAPALLKGIAALILYLFLGLVLFSVILMLLFRWRIYKVSKQMEERFGTDFDPREGFGGQSARSAFSRTPAGEREGSVKVHKTAGTPEKRVSRDVGDYVDFEETKENKEQ